MNPLQSQFEPKNEIGSLKENKTAIQNDTTKPSKSSLPKAFKNRFEAAKGDFHSSFSMIGSLVSAPFYMAFSRPSNKMQVAENILWTCLLPFTAPLSLGGALLMLPITLISGAVSFAAGKSTQEMVSSKPLPKSITPPRVDDT